MLPKIPPLFFKPDATYLPQKPPLLLPDLPKDSGGYFAAACGLPTIPITPLLDKEEKNNEKISPLPYVSPNSREIKAEEPTKISAVAATKDDQRDKQKPFKCEDCGKCFSQLRNYKYHR